jgi:hypothetical protein
MPHAGDTKLLWVMVTTRPSEPFNLVHTSLEPYVTHMNVVLVDKVKGVVGWFGHLHRQGSPKPQ